MGPSSVYETTNEFLAEYPETEDALIDLTTLDERQQTWTFDETELDSGRFGELVSRGIVERVDSEYEIVHRKAVRAAVEGDPPDFDQTRSDRELPTFPVSFDPRAAGGLLLALVVVVVGRAWTYNSVFQGDYVVSPSNDPYSYRYWQAQLLEASTGVADTSVIASLPSGARSRPFTHVANWWLTELLGGTQWAADLVAAWLPVVAAVALGIVIYFITTTLTDDARIGVAAVTLLGVTPVHAVYTSLGFLEHRLHQYFWLGIMLFALTWLAKDSAKLVGQSGDTNGITDHLSSAKTWVVTTLLLLSVIISPYVWAGSALLFMPVAGYFVARSAMDVRRGINPLRANLPVVLAFSIGGVIALLLHTQWGWHESTAFLAYTPVLVAVGGIVVCGAGEVWHRFGQRASVLIGLEATIGVVGLGLFAQLRLDQLEAIRGRADALFFREGITESISLFTRIVIGPVSQLGATFYLAVIPLGWISWVVTRRYRPEWLVPVVFGWWFLFLAAIQVRFAAQLALIFCVFGAVSIIYVLAVIDFVPQPDLFDSDASQHKSARQRLVPSENTDTDRDKSVINRIKSDPRLLVYGLGIGVLLLSANLIYAPSLVEQTTYSDAQMGAVAAIESHADATDREYPNNAVLTEWSNSRMYNYFVNGEARKYGLALARYEGFLSSPDPDEQYQQVRNRVGYVVVTDINMSQNTTQRILYEDFGAGKNATAHHQLIYTANGIRVFAFVESATITTTVESGDTVAASTEVERAGRRFDYTRSATAGENGTVSIEVAYPGEYNVGNQTVVVTDSDIRNGKMVSE